VSPDSNVRFTFADLERWAAQGLLTTDQVAAIRRETESDRITEPVRRERKLDLVTIAYYFGAFMVLFAYTVYMGLQWEALGPTGQLVVSTGTLGALCVIGAILRRSGFVLAGSLLIFAGIGITPLVAYSAERLMGIWPIGELPPSYRAYYLVIGPAFVYMELAAIAAAAAAAWLIRFPLLTLLVAFWSWFLSTDVTRVITRTTSWSWDEPERVVGVAVALGLLAVGIALQVRARRDYSFWLYLFGHIVLIGNLSALAFEHEGWLGLAYLATYLMVVVASVWLQRRVFLVFGALGVYSYVSYLAFRVFEGTLGFVFACATVGLLLVFGAIAYQRLVGPWLTTRLNPLPR
jgi:hypothetical protein